MYKKYKSKNRSPKLWAGFGIPHKFIEIPFHGISMNTCKDCKRYHMTDVINDVL
jgi:hypothetical protein